MAQTFNLGPVAIVPKGSYSASATYSLLQTVTHKGGSWLCLQQATGIEPGTDAAYWLTMANGVQSITMSAVGSNQSKMTIAYTNGSSYEFTFTNAAIGANSVTSTALANNSVTAPKIAANAVTTEKLAAGAVTNVFTVSFPQNAWTAQGDNGYKQTYTNAQVADLPTAADIVIGASATAAQGKAALKNWGLVFRIDISAGSLTVWCTKQPTGAFSLKFMQFKK